MPATDAQQRTGRDNTAHVRGQHTSRPILHPEFARRLNQACDQHPHCPPLHRGRLGWVREQLAKAGGTASNETVRKWLEGENKPRQEKGVLLAQILEVDDAWLLLGYAPEMSPREHKARNAEADGATNLIAGFIRMDGGHPAFPDEDGPVHLHAIIRGAKYDLHVALGDVDGSSVRFFVPPLYADMTVLGVVREGFSIDVFELTPEIIEQYGTRRGGSIEVEVEGSTLQRIETFSQRF